MCNVCIESSGLQDKDRALAFELPAPVDDPEWAHVVVHQREEVEVGTQPTRAAAGAGAAVSSEAEGAGDESVVPATLVERYEALVLMKCDLCVCRGAKPFVRVVLSSDQRNDDDDVRLFLIVLPNGNKKTKRKTKTKKKCAASALISRILRKSDPVVVSFRASTATVADFVRICGLQLSAVVNEDALPRRASATAGSEAGSHDSDTTTATTREHRLLPALRDGQSIHHHHPVWICCRLPLDVLFVSFIRTVALMLLLVVAVVVVVVVVVAVVVVLGRSDRNGVGFWWWRWWSWSWLRWW